jgi:hypothetical protein
MVMNTKVVQLQGADGDDMNVTALVAKPEVTSGCEMGAEERRGEVELIGKRNQP